MEPHPNSVKASESAKEQQLVSLAYLFQFRETGKGERGKGRSGASARCGVAAIFANL